MRVFDLCPPHPARSDDPSQIQVRDALRDFGLVGGTLPEPSIILVSGNHGCSTYQRSMKGRAY
jgi:hypothetical protein